MTRKWIPRLGMAGVLWASAWWFTQVGFSNPVFTVEKVLAVWLVTFITFGLLRAWIGMLPARTTLGVLSASFAAYSLLLLGLGSAGYWQMSVLVAGGFLATIGASIGLEKMLGMGWQYTLQQVRGLLAGALLLVTAASLFPLLHAAAMPPVPELAWISKAGAWLASFRFR